MNKLFTIIAILAMVGIVSAANETSLQDTGTVNLETNCKVIKLHTAMTNASRDTFATTIYHTYGPYDLTHCDGCAPYSGFTVHQMDAATGTTPTLSLGYEVIAGTSIKDTSGSWTEADTLDGTAHSQYTALTNASGKAIVFRIDNYDGTASQIPGDLWISFKPNESVYRNRR